MTQVTVYTVSGDSAALFRMWEGSGDSRIGPRKPMLIVESHKLYDSSCAKLIVAAWITKMNNPDSTGKAIKASPNLLVEVVEDDLLVLDRTAGWIHKLNPSASIIWRAIERGSDPASIASELSETYDIGLETATRDTREILSKFASLSMIEPTQ